MSGIINRHPNISLLAALLAFSLSFFYLSAREENHLTPVQKAAVSIMSPFQNALGWVVDNATGSWEKYIFLIHSKEENKLLRQRINKLVMENARLSERLGQLKRIEALIGAGQKDPSQIELARVVARDTSGLVRMITIDKGSASGLLENMPVISHRGLVGRIIMASSTASKVLLITDVRSAVDALTQENRDGLVASGTNSSMLKVRYLKTDAKVTEGETIVSSGLGGVYPKGLPIGSLYGLKVKSDDLFVTAGIRPKADLERLEEVLVIKDYSPVEVSQQER